MTKNQENWFALEITVDSEAIEAVEFALNELDALGTEINNLGKKQTETVCVIGYFNEKQKDEIVQREIIEALRIYDLETNSVKSTFWREIENKDWLEEWKKHWQPTKTGKFIVAPTWSEVDADESDENPQNQEIVIRIDPEMAFGTGTHETTRLCLRAIEENYTVERSFLDVGTGTGILAIAAAKLKVQSSKFKVQSYKSEFQSLPVENEGTLNFEPETLNRILACDTDETSIVIAKKNAELNLVADNINFYVGSISEETPAFDFVCANLTADVILPLLPLLVEKARKKLVLSGILKTQESLIAERLRELQISDFRIQTDGEWISIFIKTLDC
jgi:ribosomal protein L11 methyltransferase